MLRAYKYRLYPTDEQCELLDLHFHACRLVYNLGLQAKTFSYQTNRSNLSCYDLCKQLPDLKADNKWLFKINAQSLQSSLRHLDNAFNRFFKHGAKYPKFKSKRTQTLSCHFPQKSELNTMTSRLKLKKFSEGIKIAISRCPIGTLRNAVVVKSNTNKYYACLTYETHQKFPEKVVPTINSAVGIDLGLTHFAVLSSGCKIDNPKFLQKQLSRIKILQTRQSRRADNSNRKQHYQLKINKLYEKVTNRRTDFLHKLSSEIINQYDTVCIEDLSIKNLMKNHAIAGAIGSVSWYKFRQMLSYKAEWKGKTVLVINKFEPSSKRCSCGHINTNLVLSERVWSCPNCGTVNDRDMLAANNIKSIALSNLKKESGEVIAVEDVELPTMVGVKNRQYHNKNIMMVTNNTTVIL